MDTFSNRILLHLARAGKVGMFWNELKQSLEDEVGLVDPSYLRYKLKKLKKENKVVFIQLGDSISYRLFS